MRRARQRFLAIFFLCCLPPSVADATKPTVPLSVSLTLDQPAAFTGTKAELIFTVTPQVALTQAQIAFKALGGAILSGTSPSPIRDWPKGETRVFRIPFHLTQDRALLQADAAVTSDTVPPFGRRDELFFIRNAGRVFYAGGGFINAEQERIAYDLARYRHVPFLYQWLYKRALRAVMAGPPLPAR